MTMAGERTRRTPLFTRTERNVAWAVGAIIVFAILGLALWHTVVVRIPSGEVGVRYSLLFGGTVTTHVLPEGIATKLPWDDIYRYEVRVQRLPIEMVGLSAEGMTIQITGAVLYRVVDDEAGVLHKTVGPDYRERIILPVSLASIREVTARYGSQELYSIDYDKLRTEVLVELRSDDSFSLIKYVDLAVTEIKLPDEVTAAIEAKLAQEQIAAAYQFRLLTAQREAERKRIEAIGIRTYYSIVAEALNKTLLTWRGIEATVQLAQSPNTKIVIVGGGEDQMPLILGSDIANAPTTPVPASDTFSLDEYPVPDVADLPPLFPDSNLDLNSTGTPEHATGDTSSMIPVPTKSGD